MKERPLIVTGSNVPAIIKGLKTQTRRVMKVQPNHVSQDFHTIIETTGNQSKVGKHVWMVLDHQIPNSKYFSCPYGKVGDQLWVRETFCATRRGIACASYSGNANHDIIYKSDGKVLPDNLKYKPSIHMPRWASRINLKITDIRVERVQDISAEDARAEGCHGTDRPDISGEPRYEAVFRNLWDSINAKRGYGWEKNPWVWVVEFESI